MLNKRRGKSPIHVPKDLRAWLSRGEVTVSVQALTLSGDETRRSRGQQQWLAMLKRGNEGRGNEEAKQVESNRVTTTDPEY